MRDINPRFTYLLTYLLTYCIMYRLVTNALRHRLTDRRHYLVNSRPYWVLYDNLIK